MVVHEAIRTGFDRAAAVWALRGSRHGNQPIEVGRPRPVPAGMAQRRTAFLRAFGRSRFCGNFGVWLFLLRLELFLTFGLEFPFKLFNAGGEFLDGMAIGRGLLPQAIDLTMQCVGPLDLLVGSMHERAQRRTAQVRAVVDVRATELVLGVEDEVHRRPVLGKRDRCRKSTLSEGMAQ